MEILKFSGTTYVPFSRLSKLPAPVGQITDISIVANADPYQWLKIRPIKRTTPLLRTLRSSCVLEDLERVCGRYHPPHSEFRTCPIPYFLKELVMASVSHTSIPCSMVCLLSLVSGRYVGVVRRRPSSLTIVLGIGLFFSAFMLCLTAIQARYTAFSPKNSEEFTSASRSVKPGLIASGIVSAWTWAATLVPSPF